VDEIGDQPAAVGGVDDLRVELDAVEAALVVGAGGERAPSDWATMRKPGGRASTLSPWLIHTWCFSPVCPQAVEQCGNRP
jgi:hypothetical protein